MLMKCFPIIYLMFFLLNGLSGQERSSDRMKSINDEIRIFPDSAELYFIRGTLNLNQSQFQSSIDDFNTADQLGYKDSHIHYNKAVAFFNLKNYDNTILMCDRMLSTSPKHIPSTRLKAKAYFEKGEYGKAGLFFNRILDLTKNPTHENYIEASQAWQLFGGEMALLKSENIMLKGIKALGYNKVFYDRLVLLSTLQRDFKKVIEYQTIILNESKGKERALYNRGITYAVDNQKDKALKDFLDAKKAIGLMKKKKRKEKATIDLLQEIEIHIANLTGEGPVSEKK